MPSGKANTEDLEGVDLINKLEASQNMRCASCGRAMCSHQVLMNLALGVSRRCLDCASKAMDQPAAELVRSLFEYIQGRDCYRAAWKWASQKEGVEAEGIPTCVLGPTGGD